MNPYSEAIDYRDHGWFGAIPLPYKEKHPPPTGYIGHNAPHPDLDRIEKWLNGEDIEHHGGRSNIAIRLAGCTQEYEILGIDVDHYKAGEKDKRGYDQLKELEAQLGKLPETWISSSRTDGKSGIRYFLVPRGFAYRGKIASDIECISKGNRFAVVWPSIHPDGPTYWWFPPGIAPNKGGKSFWAEEPYLGQIPDAKGLPLLPQAWHDYLTQGGMRADAKERIDMEASVQEIYDWADATFHGDDDSPMCTRMAKAVAKQKEDISNEATSHDKITKAHWNIYRLAAEGHMGWNQAVNEIEQFYSEDTLERGKRDLSEVRNEIFRSRTNGLRKIKAQIDNRVNVGAVAVDPQCTATGMCGTDNSGTQAMLDGIVSRAKDEGDDTPPDGPLDDIARGPIKPADDYRMNDDGNADFFADMFRHPEIGPSVRFAEGHGWIVWHNGREGGSSDTDESSDQPAWRRDETGEQEMRRMWHLVRDRQEHYVDALKADYEGQLALALAAGGPIPAPVKAAKTKYELWKRFATSSGNNRNAENALQALKSVEGVSISVNDLDQNPLLLGVSNGIVELDGENVRLRRATPGDFVTFNTGVPWEQPTKFAQEKWTEYLNQFLPSKELQRATQIALGHCLIGGNPEKIMIVLKGDPNTGKSTMISTVQAAMGDYAEPVNKSIFQNHKLNPVLASALNKRVIVCSEFDEEDELSASVLKQITGGTDEIRAEIKNSNAKIVGVPQFVPILATNEVPKIQGADKALQNRLFVIPFDVVPDRIDKRKAGIVQTVCAAACLNWLIEGYVEYRRQGGLVVSEEIQNTTESFVAELDDIATFAQECIGRQTNPAGYVTRRALYERFNRWWVENDFRSSEKPSMPRFTRRLRALGYKTKDTRYRVNSELNHWWTGMKIVAPTAPVVQMPNIDRMRANVPEISETGNQE